MIVRHCPISKYSFLHPDSFLYALRAPETSYCRTTSCHLFSILFKPMVINIPSESEASNATVISIFPINEEVETKSATSPQLQQSLETDAMARTRNPQTIPTPSSRPVPNPVQEIPVIPGDSSTWPQPRQKKRKFPDTLGERGKTPATDQGTDDEDEELLPQVDPQKKWADLNSPA